MAKKKDKKTKKEKKAQRAKEAQASKGAPAPEQVATEPPRQEDLAARLRASATHPSATARSDVQRRPATGGRDTIAAIVRVGARSECRPRRDLR
jgi:hypothetical protein